MIRTNMIIVGALQDGVPAEIVKAETADHLYVPAGSEVVLEGYIIPRKRTVEGPFGEFPGSYSGSRLQCEVQITCITHRTNPIFENLYLGHPVDGNRLFAGAQHQRTALQTIERVNA